MDIQTLLLENTQLKKTLNTAISEAKLNDAVLKRFMDIEIKLLSCAKLADLISLLLRDFKETFKLSIVTIFLHDKDDLVSPLLNHIAPDIRRHLSLMFNTRTIDSIYPDMKVRAGEIDRDLRKRIFPDNPFILSCVLLPLIHKGQLIGSLHLGAKDQNRYHSGFKYDYLERMSALLAVCIENCIIQENLAYLSSTDTLTKIYNRHSFDLEIDKALQRSSRHKQYLSLLFLDIDFFKKVNDTYGHSGGDAILKTFANLLKMKIRNTDFLARFGGEEFAILLPDCDPAQAEQIANNLRESVAEHSFDTQTGSHIKVTTSIGISSYLFNDESVGSFSEQGKSLLRSSDEALYQAKKQGRNRTVFKAMTSLNTRARL